MPKASRSWTIAKQCLNDAKGDREKATRAMRKLADEDQALWRELTVGAIDGIIWEMIRHVGRRIHAAAWRNEAGGETIPKFSIYFYPLPNGVPLGKATKEDIQAAIDQRAGDLGAAKRDIAWYTAIMRRLKDKQTVEQALSEDELRRLQERALNGAKVKAA